MSLLESIKNEVGRILKKKERYSVGKNRKYWNEPIKPIDLMEFVKLQKLILKSEYDYYNRTKKNKHLDENLEYRWNSYLNGKRKTLTHLKQFSENQKETMNWIHKRLNELGMKYDKVDGEWVN